MIVVATLEPHDEESEGNAEGFSEEVGRAWEKAFFRRETGWRPPNRDADQFCFGAR